MSETETPTAETVKYTVKVEFDADAAHPEKSELLDAVEAQLANTFSGIAKISVSRRGVNKRLTEEEKQEICSKRRRGAPYKALAEEYGVSTGAINGVLRAAGLTRMWAVEAAPADDSDAGDNE